MPSTSVGVAAEAAPKSFVGRFFGIITSPKETFRSVVAHPRWFGMLAVTNTVSQTVQGRRAPQLLQHTLWLADRDGMPLATTVVPAGRTRQL